MGGPAIGEVLSGRYELREVLGEAPTHRTYRAFDREVEALVELWWHRPDVLGAEHADAFLRRVATVRQVVDPHLRRLHDAGRAGEAVYLTCQLASGGTLATRLREVAPEPVDVGRHAAALSAALSAVHAAELVHGRLTPRDVAVVAGRIKIAGAGLFSGIDAAVFAGDGRYLAPEVIAGRPATPRSDVYGMAAVIADAAACGVGEGARRRLVDRQPALWAVLSPALADEPERRPESAAELGARLAEVLEPQGVAAAVDGERAASGPALEVGEATAIDLRAAPPGAEDAGEEGTAARAASLPPPAPQLADGAEPASGERAPAAAGEAADDEPTIDTRDAEPPRFVSMKPTGEPGGPRRRGGPTPMLPLVDRPDRKPRLHTPPEARAAPASLGRLAPPRRPRRPRAWVYLVVGLGAALLTSIAMLLLSRDARDARDAPQPAPVALPPDAGPSAAPPPPTVTAAPEPETTPACPAGMLDIPEAQACVDAFESPGRGRLPETGLSRAAAAAACAARGARLCTAEEWEAACRGEDGASWPYGAAERPALCNVEGDTIRVAGAFADCRDRHGLFDMSGNAAEWTQEGQIRGGSAVDGSSGRCSQRRPRPGRQEAYSDVGFRCCSDRVAPPQPAR